MRRLATLLLLATIALPAYAQSAPPAQAPIATVAADDASFTPDQLRDIVRRAAEKDIENDRQQRDYTYVSREEEHRLDGDGHVKSTEITTHEVMILYGQQVERLIAKDDKPLSEKDAAKEEERVAKIVEKRKNETDEQRAKRLREEEKNRDEARRFVKEIGDAYNFSLAGLERLDGRETYMIDAVPRPGYEPHGKGAKFLPKFRFRVWIDKAETQWVKLDAQAIDTVSIGLFLARLHRGGRILVEQTRVNDEVWLPRHVAVKIDMRVALLKNFNIEQDVTYRDYKKFRSEIKILPGATEVQSQQ